MSRLRAILRRLSTALTLVGIAVLAAGSLFAQAIAVPTEHIPGWLTGGFALSVLGMVLNFGTHVEFKRDAKRRLDVLETRMATRVGQDTLERSIDRVIDEMDRRFTAQQQQLEGIHHAALRLMDRRNRTRGKGEAP